MKTILDAIGDTPFLEIEGIWVKMEYLNPSGSIKARIAKYMIERAESEGLLKKGDTIVEASSGNTGNAMSMVAAVGYFAPQQFDNEWNVIENHDWLGQEILRELPAKPDLVVGGVGTGGTLIGVGKAFKEINPECKSYALEPSESCTIACGEVAKHLIEGISDGFIPGIIERHAKEIDGFVHIHSHDAIAEMRRLARNHGIFIGPSSGAHMLAAKQLKEELGLETIVTFFCDEGEKYINDYWLNPA